MKSSKLYSDSPSIKKDGDGKPGIKKPSEATGEDIGTGGNPLPGSDGKMPIEDEHYAEHKSMHKRHQEEQTAMHERHAKDLKEMHGRHEKTSIPQKEKESE